MEITSLPTESLYKFMAFSGLLILFGTAAYAYKFITAVKSKLIELRTEVALFKLTNDKLIESLDSEANAIDNKFKLHADKLKNAFKEANEELTLDNYNFEYEKVNIESNSFLAMVRQKRFDIDIAGTQLEGKVNLLEFEKQQEKYLKIGCAIAFLFGSILTYYGFKEWSKMQFYVNQSIIKEASKK